MIKTAATAGFRVVIFRRFSSETAKPHRLNVMPLAGAFGVVAAIADETLLDARPHFRDRLADALAGIEEISPKRGNNWLEYVKYELRRADLVVFHWPDDAPTYSMRKELVAARRYLPSSRLLWITPPDKQDVLRRWLHRHTGEPMEALRVYALGETDRNLMPALAKDIATALGELGIGLRPCFWQSQPAPTRGLAGGGKAG